VGIAQKEGIFLVLIVQPFLYPNFKLEIGFAEREGCRGAELVWQAAGGQKTYF
jgi:hypothetical protein